MENPNLYDEWELEKLKAKNKELLDRIKFMGDIIRTDSKKLMVAKELIRNLLELAEMDNREYEKAYKEAQQFLKEE